MPPTTTPDKIEKPKEYTPWNVMYWEPVSQELRRDGSHASILKKAKDFIEGGCIEKTDSGWICKPLFRYNKTTHRIQDLESGIRCSCQGWNTNGFCAHCLAVKQFEFMR